MIGSAEFIKGYSKIIICSYLFKHSDYLYNVVKQILNDGAGYIKISNSSAIMVMNELINDDFVTFVIVKTEDNQEKKYFKLTESGKEFYLSNRNEYVKSLSLMQTMIGNGDENRI